MSAAPKRRLTLVIDGETYQVEVGDLASSPVTVIVNGESYQVELSAAEQAPGPSEGSSRRSSAPPEPPARRHTPARASNGHSGKDVTAPIPGDVIDIQVAAGQQVRAGQTLCSLEAMKMKNAIRANREGVIAAVHVNEGQTVAYGDVLMSFE